MAKGRLYLALIFIVTLISVVALPSGSVMASGSARSLQAQGLQTEIDHQLRTTSGGIQVSSDTVAYNGGSVLVIFSPLAQACPRGWYCFYSQTSWDGRMLQFKDCGGYQYFSHYGFVGKTRSWDNETNHRIQVFNNAPRFLWEERRWSRSRAVSDYSAAFFYCWRL